MSYDMSSNLYECGQISNGTSPETSILRCLIVVTSDPGILPSAAHVFFGFSMIHPFKQVIEAWSTMAAGVPRSGRIGDMHFALHKHKHKKLASR